jgi:hypothetical protein
VLSVAARLWLAGEPAPPTREWLVTELTRAGLTFEADRPRSEAGLAPAVRARRLSGDPAGTAGAGFVLDERGVLGQFVGDGLLELGPRQREQLHVSHQRRCRHHPDCWHLFQSSIQRRHRAPSVA